MMNKRLSMSGDILARRDIPHIGPIPKKTTQDDMSSKTWQCGDVHQNKQGDSIIKKGVPVFGIDWKLSRRKNDMRDGRAKRYLHQSPLGCPA